MNDEIEPDSTFEGPGTADAGEDGAPPLAALVQIEDGLAVLYGDHLPAGAEFIPFTLIDEPTRASISTAIASASGFGNTVAQGVNGIMQAQGLVRLAPQTLEQLKTAAPLMKGGWNLGTLASEGKFVAQVRWLPAGGASAASVIASMGPALTMMAIQFQLNQIADLAQHNLELTSKVLQVVRQELWSQVTGYHNTLLKELGNAREIGMVTDAIYKEIRGYQGPLSTQWDLFEKAIHAHVKELRPKQGHKERQQYLTDHGEAIIADVQALLLAQTSWFLYQALRAGHLLNSAGSNPQDAALLKKLVTDAQELHDKALDETNWLLEELAREFAVIGELPGKRTFKIGGSARAAKESARMVRQLQKALAAVRDEPAPTEPKPLALPSTQVFDGTVPAELQRILPLRLQNGERVLALADATCDRWGLHLRDAGWVAVTNQRVLIAKQDSLRRLGTIDIELDLDDIRYVRRPDRSDKAPVLDIITTETNLTLKFHSWAKSGVHRTAAERFGELLASFMQLPASEVPTVQIPELTVRDAEGPHALGE
ncbi:hypothetical protein GCM10010399_55400 [Dactylosporangium fulvum]|uniref:YokE-like PH domain-containing protein n=1 Tax=Dactylosporangium fulvum TaxID=53359 RepID=A0ABY5VZ88_9ACTN|nr:hypothetical protein [Dactylosporangium fulvum]UWP83092.1 hypothetical protein Dfulv_01930 [Dactylosporangium fulvum]